MPASGVIAGPAVIGTAAEPPLMKIASSPDGPITASERRCRVRSGSAPRSFLSSTIPDAEMRVASALCSGVRDDVRRRRP